MDNMTNDEGDREEIYLRANLKGATLRRFLQLKAYYGLDADTELIRVLINEEYRRRKEQLSSFEELDLGSRFEHFNVYMDHVTIWDRKVNRLIDVHFRDGHAYCDYDEAEDCEHIRFALSLPKVVEMLREADWVIKDGKIVRGPY